MVIASTNKIPVIVGLGKTGLSCAEHLAQRGFEFAITDSRETPPGLATFRELFPLLPVSLGRFDEELMLHASELIVSQGVSLLEPAIQKARSAGVPVIGDIELFARAMHAPVVAITGSNAKSTVTSLVGEMAKRAGLDVAIGGNLGTPALALLRDKEPDLYVLEVSNFQLEMTESLQPKVATILNISPDHLDHYHAYAEYIAAKQRVYRHCEIAVFNRDDPLTYVHDDAIQKVISFGQSEPKAGEFGLREHNHAMYLAYGEENLLPVSRLLISGTHNALNALSALAIGSALALPLSSMLDTLMHFRGLPHRCEWVITHNDVAWYNDSKGTNVGATLAAIEGIGCHLTGKIILLAGGIGKGADFSPLVPVIEKYVRTVILFGQDAALLERELINASDEIIQADSLAEAVRVAKLQAQPGDVVLLSPACASWDMFLNFEDRGEQFCALVREALHTHENGE